MHTAHCIWHIFYAQCSLHHRLVPCDKWTILGPIWSAQNIEPNRPNNTRPNYYYWTENSDVPSSKQFTRKWFFICEKLCPDATFNIQRAITTLTLLPLLPNEQLKHQTNNSLSFHSFFYRILSLCVVFRCPSSSSFLERFHWLNTACHWGIQHSHTHTHNYQTQTI